MKLVIGLTVFIFLFASGLTFAVEEAIPNSPALPGTEQLLPAQPAPAMEDSLPPS